MNFLEQLVAEWYKYKGYFVRTNVRFGKRQDGGYEGEIDVLAFNPKENTLVHLETSSDAESWDLRQEKFGKKFRKAQDYYKSILGFDFKKIKKIAVVSFGRSSKNLDLGNDVEVLQIPKLMHRIKDELRKLDPRSSAVPEEFPLLRAIQFAVWFGDSGDDN